MHSSRKGDHAGAAPAGRTSSQLPRSSTAEHPPLKRTVDGASPSGAANSFREAKADERAAAGWKPDGPVRVRRLWSMSTDFRQIPDDPFFYESETCPSNRKTGCESRTGYSFLISLRKH
jgi:hypothetical protein